MIALTERQQQILSFIQEFIESEGFPPTRAEIADALGFRSANAAEDHLKALVRKGAVEILSGTSRGIRILSETKNTGLPIVERVTAGKPLLADENLKGRVRVEPGLFRPRADFLVRIKGHSLRDAGILDGDMIAVHKTRNAKSGQLVVARLGDDVSVRRYRRRGNIVRLIPEGPKSSETVVDLREDDLTIEGVGVGVIRSQKSL